MKLGIQEKSPPSKQRPKEKEENPTQQEDLTGLNAK